ncbi:hypothetical protein FACS1894166_02410 [Bacilli bacterium]|nr:hypothetical protein FACS1894166_02410 [Bacilli bacterium]
MGFRGGNRSGIEFDFLKVCAEKKYSGIEFASEISSIGNNAFAFCAGFGHGSPIKTISMNSVTTIDINAFFGCESLTSINLGSSVISIGESAFDSCSSLTSISSSGDVTVSSIGTSAFQGCTKFTGIDGGKLIVTHIPGQSSIGSGAFHGCANLSLDFIKNMKVDAAYQSDDTTKLKHGTDKSLGYDYICPVSSFTLGTNSMYESGAGCLLAGSIPSYDLPTTIGDYAFNYCSSLTSISSSGDVTVSSIGISAFEGCTKFTGIDGGKLIVTHITGQSSIGAGAFGGCANLSLDFIKNMNVDAACLDDDTTKLIHGTDKSLGYDYICPASSFTLGTNSMYNYGSGCLLAGSIPSSALSSSIIDFAFFQCASLNSIDCSSSTSIGLVVFSGCATLNNFLF